MTITESLNQEKSLRSSRKTIDVATEQMLEYASKIGIDTVFHRQQKYDETVIGVEKSRCYFGSLGICCKQCAIGPCRIWHEDLPMRYKVITPELDKGTCGASADTIVARNLLMMVSRGTAAHSGHAKHVADALLKTAHNQGNYVLKDTDKLIAVANKLGIDTSLPKEKIAESIAKMALSDFTFYIAHKVPRKEAVRKYKDAVRHATCRNQPINLEISLQWNYEDIFYGRDKK